jgi:peptidoglycan/LPS O-acetylase OafA/YrhL
MIAYRPDVDGLRALAILSVVAFHANAAWLPGGFIGVDIFFVISGYLITKIIAKDIAHGNFSIARFYVRRAKRILPALFTVLVASWLLGLLLLTPNELSNLGKSIAATTGFVSNITFWREIGYFDIAAERKPLLHTWSLAVEEQFYLVWPLVLVYVSRTRLNRRHLLLALIALSFALSAYAVVRQPPAAFFLIPTRAWELLIGAMLALGVFAPPANASIRNACAATGLALIATGLIRLDHNSAFPGWNALYPCLGTALLIHAGEQGENVLSRHLLARRPVVFIGLVSYSFYLWHWPLLALGRITQRGDLSQIQSLSLLAIAFLLSVLTWHFVETPFRARKPVATAAPILARYGLVSVLVGALGISTHLADGFIDLAHTEVARAELARRDGNPLSGTCLRWQAQTGELAGTECVTDSDRFPARIVLWGDSHADALAPGLVDYAKRHGRALYQLTMASCPPLLGARVEGPVGHFDGCTKFNEDVIRYITQTPAVEVVALSARWTVYTENKRVSKEDSGPITYLVDETDRARTSETSRRVFARTLDNTVAALRASGKKVVILGPVPALGINIPTCLARNYLPLGGQKSCAALFERVAARNEATIKVIQAVTVAHPGVCVFYPHTVLCNQKECPGTHGDKILYVDDDHLSATGAIALSQHFDFERCAVAEP